MEEDNSVGGGPGCMLIGRRQSGGGVRQRPVSGVRGKGGGVLLGGTASRCWKRQSAEDELHSTARCGSDIEFLFSACLAIRRVSNCWIVSSLQKKCVRMDERAIWQLSGSSRSLRLQMRGAPKSSHSLMESRMYHRRV